MVVHSDDESSTKVDNSKELSCLNILSIDFDWTMSPSIEAYNGLTNKLGPDFWKEFHKQMPGIQYDISIDQYMYLSRLLIDKVTSNTKIIVNDNHDGILPVLEENTKNRKYRIYNIDHHHDLGYPDNNDITLKELSEKWTLANWAAKCLTDDNCLLYQWICNYNSNKRIPKCLDTYSEKYLLTPDIDSISHIQVDIIFICLSPLWVPPKYYQLFDVLVNFIDALSKK